MVRKKKFNQNYFSFTKIIVTWVLLCFLLYALIGALTYIPKGKNLSNSMLATVSESIDFSFYLMLLTTEYTALREHYHDELPAFSPSEFFFQLATQLNLSDVRTLFGNELPGFQPYRYRIVVGQSDTNYTNLPVESSPPLDMIMEERTVSDSSLTEGKKDQEHSQIEEPSILIYNTHNRESFLPHLEGVTDPNAAFHPDVNVTLVSEELKKHLATKGIGSIVDQTDFTKVLYENGWEYWQSYDASKPVVEDVIAQNDTVQYIFDLHRDSRRKDDTTITIDGKEYARLFFVIGADYEGNEKNTELAIQLHERLEDTYPGLSRGVVEMGGTGRNGVYNQNLSDNALLIEFGGVDNTFEELYRSAEALSDVFADYYWDAEPASTDD